MDEKVDTRLGLFFFSAKKMASLERLYGCSDAINSCLSLLDCVGIETCSFDLSWFGKLSKNTMAETNGKQRRKFMVN